MKRFEAWRLFIKTLADLQGEYGVPIYVTRGWFMKPLAVTSFPPVWELFNTPTIKLGMNRVNNLTPEGVVQAAKHEYAHVLTMRKEDYITQLGPISNEEAHISKHWLATCKEMGISTKSYLPLKYYDQKYIAKMLRHWPVEDIERTFND